MNASWIRLVWILIHIGPSKIWLLFVSSIQTYLSPMKLKTDPSQFQPKTWKVNTPNTCESNDISTYIKKNSLIRLHTVSSAVARFATREKAYHHQDKVHGVRLMRIISEDATKQTSRRSHARRFGEQRKKIESVSDQSNDPQVDSIWCFVWKSSWRMSRISCLRPRKRTGKRKSKGVRSRSLDFDSNWSRCDKSWTAVNAWPIHAA